MKGFAGPDDHLRDVGLEIVRLNHVRSLHAANARRICNANEHTRTSVVRISTRIRNRHNVLFRAMVGLIGM